MLLPQAFGLPLDRILSNGCIERDATPAVLYARVGASTISPQHFPAYLPALPPCYHPAPEPPGTVKLGRASHVSLHCRGDAPPPSICLLGIRLFPGFPLNFHPARFQSRWCTHKQISSGMARLPVTAHHNLPHSVLV